MGQLLQQTSRQKVLPSLSSSSGQKPWRKPLLRLQSFLETLWFLRFAPASLLYALKRDRTERRFAAPSTAASPTPAGPLQQVVSSERGAVFTFERATLEVDFLTADLVRLSWQPGLLPVAYAIACHDWEPVSTALEPPAAGETGEWTLSSGAVRVSVGAAGSVRVWDDAGALLRQEEPPQWLGLGLDPASDEISGQISVQSSDPAAQQPQNWGWIHTAALPEETCIYGLGERIAGLNLRAAADAQGQPKVFGFWNSDPGNIRQPGADPLYITMPVYLALHAGGSYLVFYENSFNGTMQFGAQAVAQFEGGALRYYLALGEPSQLLERYTRLTGRAFLPPLWALGYHQSRWGYRTEERVRSQIQAFQAYDLPLSAVHLDIDCQVDHRAFTLDPERFPNLCQFTRTLAEAGVHLVTINNPGIKHSRHSNLFLEGQVLNAFCTYPDGELVVAPVWPGRTVFPDFTRPQVRAWWGYQFAYLIDVGIAGFWNDMNEPAAFATWGQQTLPTVARHAMEGRGGDHREAHNLYGLLEARAAFESLTQHRPQRRPFIVTRSGWVSMQRYAWTWTGDTLSTWTALRLTVGTVIGLGLSGVPFSGPDIGGFLGNPTAELYIRWFQMAAFLPFCRTHSSIVSDPRTPWTFGEPALSIVRDFLQLRYRLLPYLYTLAWEATRSGQPLVRPLFWQDPGNRALWDIDDQFYLGNALLVCPVVQDQMRSRPVLLPPGFWYDFWSDDCWPGDQRLTLAAPLERIPLLVRGGSVLPTVETRPEGAVLTLHLYPLPQGGAQSQIYSDAGEGYGPCRLDRFRLHREGSVVTLTWEPLDLPASEPPHSMTASVLAPPEGLPETPANAPSEAYPWPYAQVQLLLHGPVIEQAWVDDQPVSVEGQQISCQPFSQARFACV